MCSNNGPLAPHRTVLSIGLRLKLAHDRTALLFSMHGRFRGLGFRGGGGGCRSHRGGAAARTPSRLASGIAARWHRLRMCSTPPAGAGEVVRHPGADSLEMDRLHPRRHRRLKGEARGEVVVSSLAHFYMYLVPSQEKAVQVNAVISLFRLLNSCRIRSWYLED